MIKKFILILFGTLFLSTSLVLPAQAGVSHNLVVYHSTKGNRLFGICSHWSTDAAASKYNCQGDWGSLYPGENSYTKYGWKDTDAVQVTTGYKLMVDRVGIDSNYASACGRRTYYVKVSPAPFNGKVKFYLKRC